MTAFTCPVCDRSSSNSNDLANRYCGACHWWTGNPDMLEPWLDQQVRVGLVSVERAAKAYDLVLRGGERRKD